MFYGLTIIAFAWLLELIYVWKGHRSLQPWFLRFAALGSLVLVLETFSTKKIIYSLPALVIFLVVLVLIWKIRK